METRNDSATCFLLVVTPRGHNTFFHPTPTPVFSLSFCHSMIILRFLLHNFSLCSNSHHTLPIRHRMFCEKIGTERSVLQKLCHFVISTYMFTRTDIAYYVKQFLLGLSVYILHSPESKAHR